MMMTMMSDSGYSVEDDDDDGDVISGASGQL